MRKSLLPHLQCPGCRHQYRVVVHVEERDRVDMGYLACDCAAAVIPIVKGFIFFNEPVAHGGLASAEALSGMALRCFGTATEFLRISNEKLYRETVEIYAAFQPFNESSRALLPLLPKLQAAVGEGDLILDTYCRTGWTAEWLAGNFPQQHVVSIWEGNSSVLGYRGFRYLLDRERCPPNLDILFLGRNAPFPFRDASVSVLHGHDALHRQALYPFAAEALRVSRRDAAWIFPHVHLSNSEPDPFFERGGRIMHGRDYQLWLDAITLGSPRRGFVYSEATLFENSLVAASDATFADESDTPHYNALVAVLPLHTSSRKTPAAAPTRRFLVNPLVQIDLCRRSVSTDRGRFHGAVGKLLMRHPMYATRLPSSTLKLTETQMLAVVLGAAGLEEAAIVAIAPATMPSALRDLESQEVLRGEKVSKSAHDLQRYHSHQWTGAFDAPVASWLSRLTEPSFNFLVDATDFAVSAAETADLMSRVPGALGELKIFPHDPLTMSSFKNPLLAIAACSAPAAGFHISIEACDDGRNSLDAHVERLVPAAEQAMPSPASAFDGRGSICLPIDEVPMRLRFADLLSGFSAVTAHHLHPLLLVDERTTVWEDFSSLVIAMLTGETIRYR